MILLKNGSIVIDNKLVKKDILIVEDKIAKIEDNIDIDAKTYDVMGSLVMPGAVDVHVHFREPGFTNKETIKTGTLSAAKGGFTTVMPMPNLNPCPDSYENLKVELDIIKKDAVINCYPYGSVSKAENGNEISNIEELKDLVYAISDDGVGVNNIQILEQAMILAKKYDLVIASHAEDLVNGKLPEGEYKAVRREIELAKKIGCRYHFCHMSTKESFDAIRQARNEGYKNITCEVAPHHLVLNETMIKNGNYKMNPPLRSEENRLATIEALLDGTAQMIATDHAPHTKEEKSKEYDKCPNGIIGLETALPIIYTNFVKTNMVSLERFLDLMCYNPIKVFKLPERKLSVGYKADICVLDIEHEREYKEEEILSLGVNSPFIGNKYYGFNILTIVDGKIKYKRG